MTDKENKTLENMSRNELRAEAKARGLPQAGSKTELFARLNESQEEGGENMPKRKPKETKEEKAKAVKEQTYISKYRELRLVNKSSYTKEVAGRVITTPGTAIEFHDGAFKTSDPAEIEFLDNHPNCGNTFIKVAGKDRKKATDEVIAERYKDLEKKEAELKAKEEALEKKEMAIKGQEEGADKPKTVSGIRSTANKPKF